MTPDPETLIVLRWRLQRLRDLEVAERHMGRADYEQFDLEDEFGAWRSVLEEIVGMTSPVSE